MRLDIRLITEESDKRRCETIIGCSHWMLHPADGNGNGYKNLCKWLKHFSFDEKESYYDAIEFAKRVALSKQPIEISISQYEWIGRLYEYVWDEIIDPNYTRH